MAIHSSIQADARLAPHTINLEDQQDVARHGFRNAASYLAVVVSAGACTGRTDQIVDTLRKDSRSLIEIAIDDRYLLRRPRHEVQMLVDIGQALDRHGDREAAMRTIDRAESDRQSIQDAGDRRWLAQYLVRALGAMGEFARARAIAEELERDKQDWVLGEIAATLADARDLADGPERDQALLRVAISAFESRDIQTAEQAAAAIQRANARDLALAHLVAAYVASGQRGRAERLLRQLSSTAKSEAQGKIATIHVAQNKLKDAFKILSGIESEVIKTRTLSEFAVAASGHGRDVYIERSMKTALEIRNPALRDAALESIARTWMAAGWPERAESAVEPIGDEESKRRLMAAIAVAYVRAKDIEKAETIAESLLSDPVWSPEAFLAIAVAHETAGRTTAAFESIRKIRNLELRIPAIADVVALHRARGVETTDAERASCIDAMTDRFGSR